MIIRTTDFSLQPTLESGQLFRYQQQGDWSYIFHRDQLFKVKQEQNKLFVHGTSRKFATRFFSLDHNIAAIKQSINKDPHINAALIHSPGLRIMKQDPWECMVSFICSSCASIPKIRLNVNLLSQKFGQPIELDEIQGYTFPAPGSLTSLQKIKNAKTGYRSKYLFALNSKNEDELQKVSTHPYAQALQQLTSYAGIGEKVADCILLFSHGFFEAFPVDTWIKKCMQSIYFDHQSLPLKTIKSFGQEYFGPYAGYAQQYLFYWRRSLGQ